MLVLVLVLRCVLGLLCRLSVAQGSSDRVAMAGAVRPAPPTTHCLPNCASNPRHSVNIMKGQLELPSTAEGLVSVMVSGERFGGKVVQPHALAGRTLAT